MPRGVAAAKIWEASQGDRRSLDATKTNEPDVGPDTTYEAITNGCRMGFARSTGSLIDLTRDEFSMPEAPTRNSRNDDLIGVIAVLVLLLGTATGNAFMMFVISLAGLGFVSGYYCGKLGGRTLLLVLMTALTAALIGTLMVTLLR